MNIELAGRLPALVMRFPASFPRGRESSAFCFEQGESKRPWMAAVAAVTAIWPSTPPCAAIAAVREGGFPRA
jgi:hypothetical protein